MKTQDIKLDKSELNTREKLTIVLVLFIINLLKPWQYSHQQDEFYEQVYDLIGLKHKKDI